MKKPLILSSLLFFLTAAAISNLEDPRSLRTTSFQSWSITHLEESLCPIPSHSDQYRLPHHLSALVYGPLSLIAISTKTIEKACVYALNLLSAKEVEKHPLEDFLVVTKDSRKWALIEETKVSFDPSFKFGVSTCTWQDSAKKDLKNSQWTDWENRCVSLEKQSEKRSNLFQLYKTEEGRDLIIDRLQQLGVNSYRFSLVWSQIEPIEGHFDEEVLQVYIHLCQSLRKAGICPAVTLLHYSEPDWFHKKGSFEKIENISYFLRFAKKVFPSLSQDYNGKPLVETIYTINELNIEGFCRHVLGSFSPGDKGKFTKAGHFLHHALAAHCTVYQALKEINPQVQIGVVHQYLEMIPTNPLIGLVTRYFNRLINETALQFYKTGIFDYKIPFFCHIYDETFKLQKEEKIMDFLGLQYYARVVATLSGSSSYHEPMTLMPYREDPEGIYTAILEAHRACGRPIRISENGISSHNEEQRERYIERALYAVHRAREEIGPENLLEYDLWCPFPTSEWDMGWKPQNFSAYALDEEGKIAANPKPGMEPFIRTARDSAKISQ